MQIKREEEEQEDEAKLNPEKSLLGALCFLSILLSRFRPTTAQRCQVTDFGEEDQSLHPS